MQVLELSHNDVYFLLVLMIFKFFPQNGLTVNGQLSLRHNTNLWNASGLGEQGELLLIPSLSLQATP